MASGSLFFTKRAILPIFDPILRQEEKKRIQTSAIPPISQEPHQCGKLSGVQIFLVQKKSKNGLSIIIFHKKCSWCGSLITYTMTYPISIMSYIFKGCNQYLVCVKTHVLCYMTDFLHTHKSFLDTYFSTKLRLYQSSYKDPVPKLSIQYYNKCTGIKRCRYKVNPFLFQCKKKNQKFSPLVSSHT